MTGIKSLFPSLKTVYDKGQFYALTPEGKKWRWDSLGLRLSNYAHIPTPPSLKDKITAAKDLLTENTALFLTIQYIWESAFNHPRDTTIYRKILQEAKVLSKEENISMNKAVKFVLFRELGKLDTSSSFVSYMKWGARHVRAFFILLTFNFVINYFANKCITAHLEQLRNFASEQQQKDKCVSLRTQLIQSVDRCLTILNGAYTAVTKKHAPSGTIEEMVANELTTANSNQGLTSDQLYKKVANKIIQTTLGTVPGFFASRLLQLFISPGQIVGSLVGTATTSAIDTKGYAHNMNLVFLAQLKNIANLLSNPGEGGAQPEPLSAERKRSLTTVINQFMELLNKTHCKTTDELSDLIAGRGFWPIVQARHSDNWAVSQIMEAMVVTVANLFHQMVSEKKIDELTLQMLEVTNGAFQPSDEISDSQKEQTENEVASTTRKILKLAIDNGIYGALTSTDPCFGSYYIPQPIAITKKVLSTVRFVPALLKPSRIAFFAAVLSPLYSHTVADYTRKLLQDYDITTLSVPSQLKEWVPSQAHQWIPQVIDLASWVSSENVQAIQDYAKSHLRQETLYVAAPLALVYGIYQIAHSRATSKVQQLFRLAIQPNTYLSGLHHLAMLPYVKGT